MDFNNKTKEELESLYNAAVDAYEAGEPILSDEEYDSLVSFLDRENEAQIGSVSKSSAYTVKHSVIMGSLDKVHVEEDDVTHERNYAEAVRVINMHLRKATGIKYIICMPKYDGCSFSFEVNQNPSGSGIGCQCATRGDGRFGVNILPQFMNEKFNSEYSGLERAVHDLLSSDVTKDTLMIRGEALVKFDTYNRKWADKFKNLRVFVSGNINAEYDPDDPEYLEMCNDIDFVTYDYRLVNSKTGQYKELPWVGPEINQPHIPEDSLIPAQLKGVGVSHPEYCKVIPVDNPNEPFSVEKFKEVYEWYEKFRKVCPYPLDGIVIKPDYESRLPNTDRERPEDMIAVKFVTEKMESEIVDIEWSVGRTGECYPVAILKPVYQDGKTITKASLHGYSYVKLNKVGIGSKVIIVMNGDIIPGVYSVESEGVLKMPDFPTYVTTVGDNHIEHLMKDFTTEELNKHQFIVSAKALQIEGIKENTAEKIYDIIGSDNLTNLMDLMNDLAYGLILEKMGDSKSTRNIISALQKYKENITLPDVIRGLGFKAVGKRLSKIAADYITQKPGVDDSDVNLQALRWIKDPESVEREIIERYAYKFGLNRDAMIEENNKSLNEATETEDKIKVILTGDPSKCTPYKTKKEWLAAHPRYEETTKWSDCKILFTNDLESKTGKMGKAAKNNVEIRMYEE